ncbi:hypothetical protein NDU88_002355 [Pleurodeles waltl]|uniref:Uncharacterized protein n=1 Tax=Pleurodeles waltl TaxID=8319 RepID=A0AAV7Q940_PLEWA|nr:hypothetical protein NDU88_002355 [Pleurodeles waltl]
MDYCLNRTKGDPCATVPVARTPPRVLRKEEHAPTSGLAGSRGRRTGPRKGEEERRGESSGSRASPPRNSHHEEQEIAGTIGPNSAEARRGPRRWSTGPRRSKEDRCDGGGGPRANPPCNSYYGEKRDCRRYRTRPRRWNIRPSRGEEDRHSGSGGPQRSPFRGSHRGEQEIAGAIKPDPVGTQRGPPNKYCPEHAHRSQRHGLMVEGPIPRQEGS